MILGITLLTLRAVAVDVTKHRRPIDTCEIITLCRNNGIYFPVYILICSCCLPKWHKTNVILT